MRTNKLFWVFAVTLIWMFTGCNSDSSTSTDNGNSGNYENKVITHASAFTSN